MVYGIVQRHNGQMEIDSELLLGTTVRMKFPRSALTEGAAKPVTPVAVPLRMRILVVDDDPMVIKSLCDTLEFDGHLVVAARGGKEGIETFRGAHERGERFASVITDLGMPDVDGRKVAAGVKAISPATPIILLTGWGQRLVAEEGLPENVDFVLNKPPKLRELRSVLAGLTRGD
jgi:CheY-like chemotaxis protein